MEVSREVSPHLVKACTLALTCDGLALCRLLPRMVSGGSQVSANVGDCAGAGYLLRATSTTVTFPGYLAVYPPKTSAGAAAICDHAGAFDGQTFHHCTVCYDLAAVRSPHSRVPPSNDCFSCRQALDRKPTVRMSSPRTRTATPKQAAAAGPARRARRCGQAVLQKLKEGEAVTLVSVSRAQHSTQPPPRYSEATLVKALEERGIGRPSTYASILRVLQVCLAALQRCAGCAGVASRQPSRLQMSGPSHRPRLCLPVRQRWRGAGTARSRCCVSGAPGRAT